MTDLSGPLASVLLWLGTVAATVGLAAGRWGRPVLRRAADLLGFCGCLLALGCWIARWLAAGHLPLFGTFESALSLVVAVYLAAAVARSRAGGQELVWVPASALCALLLAHGLGYSREIFALTISERSWVVDLHAIFAWAAFGVLALNAGLALLRLRRDPSLPDRWLSFSLSLGFVLHTAMLASGSFYKFLLFGRAWSFDPIETLGFVAWVAYGTLLHLHLFAGWEGRRLAAWSLGLFVLLVVSYRGIVYFPAWSSYHILDMDLRMHLMGQAPGGTP